MAVFVLVNVGLDIGVSVSNPGKGVNVGGNVAVAVMGAGEGSW